MIKLQPWPPQVLQTPFISTLTSTLASVYKLPIKLHPLLGSYKPQAVDLGCMFRLRETTPRCKPACILQKRKVYPSLTIHAYKVHTAPTFNRY